jgi:hypothetical protein
MGRTLKFQLTMRDHGEEVLRLREAFINGAIVTIGPYNTGHGSFGEPRVRIFAAEEMATDSWVFTTESVDEDPPAP